MVRSAIYFILSLCILADDVNSCTFLSENETLEAFFQPLMNFIEWIENMKSCSSNKKTSTQDLDKNQTEVLSCGSSPSPCTNSRYRSIDGKCNNLKNPTWGASQEPFRELVKPNDSDGLKWPKADSLPNPREISLLVFTARNVIDNKWNLNTQQWGQVIAHDMSLAATADIVLDNPPVCCDNKGKLTSESKTNPFCAPIPIPKDDIINTAKGRECMEFVKSVSTKDTGCTSSKAPAFPINKNTAYMDLSLTYGSTKEQAKSLREGRGGRLITVERNGGQWPPQASNTIETCSGAQSADEACYVAGDLRVNQNPQLTVLQVVLLKEHNRIASKLSKLNKHWDDEAIYQEARRINIAINQHINYYQYLPILLGQKNMVEKKLIYLDAKDYINDYNPDISASIVTEHAAAAYRFFHTLIRGQIQLLKENRILDRYIRLSDWFNKPAILEEKNGFDGLVIGLSHQPQDKSDQYFDHEITQYLFRLNNTVGRDLRAIDIQRGRDHKVASYMALRSYCGISVPKTFKDLNKDISKENIVLLQLLYKKVEDIELVVGGSLEKQVPGTLVGPTFLCILLEQFYFTRVGDRYFYENGSDKDIAFTPSQLETIRKGSSMARLFCDNGIDINKMQPDAFEQLNIKNKLVSCDNLPSVNLTLWKESKGG